VPPLEAVNEGSAVACALLVQLAVLKVQEAEQLKVPPLKPKSVQLFPPKSSDGPGSHCSLPSLMPFPQTDILIVAPIVPSEAAKS